MWDKCGIGRDTKSVCGMGKVWGLGWGGFGNLSCLCDPYSIGCLGMTVRDRHDGRKESTD